MSDFVRLVDQLPEEDASNLDSNHCDQLRKLESGLGLYLPAGQSVHLTAPAAEYEPAEHALQLVALVSGCCVPAGHSSQLATVRAHRLVLLH